MKYTYNIEVGVDECARGVLFGRIYAAAVIWPTIPNEKDKSQTYVNWVEIAGRMM